VARDTPVPQTRRSVLRRVLYGGVSFDIEFGGVSSRLDNRKESGREDIQHILGSGVRCREESEMSSVSFADVKLNGPTERRFMSTPKSRLPLAGSESAPQER